MSWLVPLLGLLALESATVASPPRTLIALALDEKIPAAVGRLAVAEASAIWAPYGVDVAMLRRSRTVDTGADDPADVVLTVQVTDNARDADTWAGPFASIRFLPDGEPDTAILLHYDALTHLGLDTVTQGGAPRARWPPALRNVVLGRMAGRVIAHEIGHWLLRTRSHSATGLMQAVHRTSALADADRRAFRLRSEEVARLPRRFLARSSSASSGPSGTAPR